MSVRLLLLGVSKNVAEFVGSAAKDHELSLIEDTDTYLNLLEADEINTFDLIISGPLLSGIPITEVAQSVRTVLPRAPIYFVSNSRELGYERHSFIKNGFSDAFLLPFDSIIFSRVLGETLSQITKVPVLRPVSIVDIAPETELPFDLHIFLPLNKKYIKYAHAGRYLEKPQIDRLSSHHVGAVFVPVDQIKGFYEYTADRLKTLGQATGALSETERTEKLQQSIRSLLTDVFSTSNKSNFEDGKRILADASEIIRFYLQKNTDGDLLTKIYSVIGDVSGSYSHLTNVSTFAALFSMASGVGNPEDLALAGLFHDLGLTKISHETLLRPPDTWTPTEVETYQLHPEYSIELLKEKRIALPMSVQAIILQHHERFDGRGFPNQVNSEKLREDSQILITAIRFNELTCVSPGEIGLNPMNALLKIREEGAVNPLIIDQLLVLFPNSTQSLA